LLLLLDHSSVTTDSEVPHPEDPPMFARLIAKLFAPSTRTPIRNARLTVEGLEAREVPAAFYWYPTVTGNLATDGANWKAIPTSSQGLLPGAGDDVWFETDSRFGLDADCKDFGDASIKYNSVNVVSTFTRTVTLSNKVDTEYFNLHGGVISQPGSGTDITVSKDLYWTGGKLNNSGFTAKVTVAGAVATGKIEPANAGTLELGSHFTFDGGSTGTFDAGTVTFKNDSDLIIDGFSTVSMVSPDPAQPAKLAAPPGFVITKNDVQLISGKYTFGNAVSELPVLVTGGIFYIPTGPLSKVTGQSPLGAIPNQSIFVTGGILAVEHGATLEATNGVGLTGGKLSSAPAGAMAPAKIKANVTNTGADVVISDGFFLLPGAPHFFGTLLVEGTVTWSGGTYRPVVRAQNTAEADLWKSTGTFTVGAGAKFAPGAVDKNGQPTGFPPVGQTWKILESGFMIVGVLPPQDPIGWKYTQGGNKGVITEWYVGS
jgi:hypothetical protein